MPHPTSTAPSFVLFITEPRPATRRAVQIRGLPFTIGTAPEAAVSLRGEHPSLVRVEEGPDGLRVVDVAGDGLHCDGLLADALPLTHGSSFEVGDAKVKFLIGTRESLRPSRQPAAPEEPAAALAGYLRQLEQLEAKVGELRRSLGTRPTRSRARAAAAR